MIPGIHHVDQAIQDMVGGIAVKDPEKSLNKAGKDPERGPEDVSISKLSNKYRQKQESIREKNIF